MNWSRSFAVLALLTATPAAAQVYPAEPYYRGIIPAEQVLAIAHSFGLEPVSEPRLRGPVWVVRALGRDGTLIRVAVDSYSGRVLRMHAVNESRMRDPRFVMREPSYNRAYGPPLSVPYETAPAPYDGVRAMPDDDDEDDVANVRPVPRPREYVPHSSVSPAPHSHQASKPAGPRLASRPPAGAAPLPKARPDNIQGNKSEIKKDSAAASGSKEPVVTGSVPAKENKKAETPAAPNGDPAKELKYYPVQPLE